ncbi:hypothetical protein [Mammaliicoccus lentus]|uniref:hypothetical protein n=1 Tax=Mammaliicoccus lentus TaxID=42858 RepID=UPI002DBDC281|nr:hypothetical protein [Mammaliicoccus lentus]MEB8093163.1 hypothetical protein [Mammaliicoccus lentus]
MLIDKAKQLQNESFHDWFEKFCKDYNLKDEILSNAEKGYGGMQFEIPNDEVYRFRNIHFLSSVKVYLGEGFKVDIETKRYGLMSSSKHFLVIDWSDEQ